MTHYRPATIAKNGAQMPTPVIAQPVCGPGPVCTHCGAPVSRWSTGACRRCARRARIQPVTAPVCAGCGGPVSRWSKTGRCRSCAQASRAAPRALLACRDCGKALSGPGKTGLCRVCSIRAINADPEVARRRAAAVRAALADPEVAARRSAAISAAALARRKARPPKPQRVRVSPPRPGRRLFKREVAELLDGRSREDFVTLIRHGYRLDEALASIGRSDLLAVRK